MGEDKCKEPMEKMKKAYKKWWDAEDYFESIGEEADELCATASEDCDYKNFEDKTDDELKEVVKKCRRAQARCSVKSRRWVKAGKYASKADDEYRAALRAASECEHKKKSGKK